MTFRIPPHIGWPLFIVALLLVSVSAGIITIIAAGSDGGPQIVEDYYDRAVRWDEEAARRAASAALGWEATVRVAAAGAQAGLRTVEVAVRDRDGAPVAGLRGTLRAARPQWAHAVAQVPLVPVAETPGLYRQEVPVGEAGLWDFEIDAARDTAAFAARVRVEVR